MILTIVSFSLILTPLNIATRAPNGWKTYSIIAMIVVGVVYLARIAAWEKWYAKVPYVSNYLVWLRSRRLPQHVYFHLGNLLQFIPPGCPLSQYCDCWIHS